MTDNKIYLILKSIITIFSLACVVCAVILCINGARDGILPSLDIETESLGSSARLDKTYDYGDSYIRNIAFVGDKTIYGIIKENVLADNSQVWSGVGGSLPLDYNISTASVINSEITDGKCISETFKEIKPQYIILTIGHENGVSYCNEQKFKEYYSRLVEDIKSSCAESKIILQSIFPITKGAEKKNPNIANERIDNANMWIEAVALEQSVRYLHTTSALKDKDGYLKAEYTVDGIVLNKEGYSAMIDYIKTHGYK